MLRLAILDMYDNTPNQGMRCIKEILGRYSEVLEYEVFDVRQACQIPDLSFDLYISTGGPGDPREGDGIWDRQYFHWLSQIWAYNKENEVKKYVFFICHSFQMACLHFQIGDILPRKSMSFGTFPVYPTAKGQHDPIFETLDNPFYVADFRSYQVVQPKTERIKQLKMNVLAIEKPRPQVKLERALMAVRFSDELFGTQFHPEADGGGMLIYFSDPERKAQIIEEYGMHKFAEMMRDLADNTKVERTQTQILPRFLEMAIERLAIFQS
jgi:homoserine O-succinyltransferase/O-acetyltransferase